MYFLNLVTTQNSRKGNDSMRNLEQEYRHCIEMMDEINMDYGNITGISVNNRIKRRWGQCKHVFAGIGADGKRKYNHSIDISSILLDDNTPVEALRNTIIHEILHTCPGCNNHGVGWKRRADQVNKKFGYNIKSRSSAEDKMVPDSVMEEYKKPKYILRCKKCGYEVGMYRMSKFVKHPSWFAHSNCGGDFERIA